MRLGKPAVLAGVLVLTLTGMGKTDPTPLTRLVEKLFLIPSPTGYEHLMVQEIKGTLPAKTEFSQDNLGSLYMAPAAGSPRMAVLTGMDEIGYAVSGITDEGFLTLDRGVRPPHSLYDIYQVGHPVRIWTRKGRVDGVWALPSSHTLSRARRMTLWQELDLDHAYIDIGSGSREAVVLRGVAYLDPVTPEAFIHALAGNQLSGPALGTKACVALVLDLAGNAENAAAPRVPRENSRRSPLETGRFWLGQGRTPPCMRISWEPRKRPGSLCRRPRILLP
jgi:putative aminopeptidase FrvX